MEITETSLLNMLRHAFLMGFNSGLLHESSGAPDFTNEREGALKELIEEHKMDGKTCYNDLPL